MRGIAPSERRLSCVILAAGFGTRMKSSVPKVLHTVCGKPMLQYCLEATSRLKPEKTVLVVGEDYGQIEKTIGASPGLAFAVQKERKGTAHALISAGAELKGFEDGTLLVTNGDTPLLTPGTLRRFLALHLRERNSVSVLSFIAEDPSNYGRILRDKKGNPLRVVEEKDARGAEKAVREVNSGVYAIEGRALPLLEKIEINMKKGEYYLTEILGAAVAEGLPVGVFRIGGEEEFLGVNTRKDLMRANELVRAGIIAGWMEKGVSFIDASSVFMDTSVKIGAETTIYPGVCLEGKTVIGKNCTIYPNVRIQDSTLGDGAVVKDSTLIENSTIGGGAQVGPFAHLRPESCIEDGAKIGNFVEVKKSTIGRGSKAMHLSYIGDATLGRDVNIGAGTITCNYDGKKKHRTYIEDGVFVGSDTQLVAPVRVGRGAYIGAGSTITEDVPPASLALSRVKQINLKRKKS